MSKKGLWVSIVILCFIGLNLFLIFKKDSPVERMNFISDWTEVKQKDLKNSFETSGVIDAAETNRVYIDKKKSFKQFLVKKGDPVQAGTPLFEYSGLDLNEQRDVITSEQQRLQSEAASIDQLISELESLQSSIPSDSSFDTGSGGLNETDQDPHGWGEA